MAPGVVADNGNAGGVSNQPITATTVSLSRPTTITLIETYHWNNARGGRSPGTIALRDASGRVYGPWPTTGTPGAGRCAQRLLDRPPHGPGAGRQLHRDRLGSGFKGT